MPAPGADGSWQQLFPALGSDPPDRTAISFPDRSLSYAQARVVHLLADLPRNGLGKIQKQRPEGSGSNH